MWRYDPLSGSRRGLYRATTYGDTYWQHGTFELFERAPDGVWSTHPLPVDSWLDVEALEAPDGVPAIVSYDAFPESGIGELQFYSYGPKGWELTDSFDPPTTIYMSAILPDGRWVISNYDEMWVQDGVGGLTSVRADGDIDIRSLEVAPDGTVLALGPEPAMGSVDNGLQRIVLPDFAPDRGWIGAADDVWLLEHPQAFTEDPAVVYHFDGVTWNEVPTAEVQLYDVTGSPDGSVFAVGGGAAGVDLVVGDSNSLQVVERHEDTLEGIHRLAFDDVQGAAWGTSKWGVATFDGQWRVHTQLVDPEGSPGKVAYSDGRVIDARTDAGEVLVTEVDGAVQSVQLQPYTYTNAATGAGGALYAFGKSELNPYANPYPTMAVGWASEAAGAPIATLDLSALPAGSFVESAHADAPGEVWLGLDVLGAGALARLDGSTTSVILGDLPAPVEWIGRGADGVLVVAMPDEPSGRTLFAFDGVALTEIDEVPDEVHAAHRFPDGSWLVAVDDPTRVTWTGSLEHVRPDGSSTVLNEDTEAPILVGAGDTAWAIVDGDVAHTVTCPE